jgi:hypothetical protein
MEDISGPVFSSPLAFARGVKCGSLAPRLCSARSSLDLVHWTKSWLLRSQRSSHSHSIVPGGFDVMS